MWSEFTTNIAFMANLYESPTFWSIVDTQICVNRLITNLIHQFYNFCKARRLNTVRLENMVIITPSRIDRLPIDRRSLSGTILPKGLLRHTKMHDIPPGCILPLSRPNASGKGLERRLRNVNDIAVTHIKGFRPQAD